MKGSLAERKGFEPPVPLRAQRFSSLVKTLPARTALALQVGFWSFLRATLDREPHRLVLYAFDLLYLNGEDWRRAPLFERRARLQGLIPEDSGSAIQFSEHYEGSGAEIFQLACDMGLEGIVSKRASAAYRSGPSRLWLRSW